MTMARKEDGDASITVSRPMLKFIGAHLASLVVGSGVVGGVSYRAMAEQQEVFEAKIDRMNDAAEKRYDNLNGRIDKVMEILTHRAERVAANQ